MFNLTILYQILLIIGSTKALIFMRNVAIGNLITIAVPLQTNDPYLSNVFCSYNFESNYGASTSPADVTTGYLDKFMLPYDRSRFPENRERPLEGRSLESRKHLITRKNIYKIIEGHIKPACLWRSICEASLTPFSKFDGFIGDIVHIVLSPSMSIKEDIDSEYYDAEEEGHLKGNCVKYEGDCPDNPLDIITKVF